MSNTMLKSKYTFKDWIKLIFLILSGFLILSLAINSIIVTVKFNAVSVASYIDNWYLDYANAFNALIASTVAVSIILIILRLNIKISNKCIIIVKSLIVLSLSILGIIWINISNITLWRDQSVLYYTLGNIISRHDYSGLDIGGCIWNVPFNAGILFLFESLFRLFHTFDTKVVYYINLFCMVLIYLIACKIIKSNIGKLMFSVMYITNIQFLFYVTFFYGEIISIACGVVLIYLTGNIIENSNNIKWYAFVQFSLVSALGVISKGNFWVVVISCSIILMIKCFTTKTYKFLLLVGLIIVSPIILNKAICFNYGLHSSFSSNSGMPYSAHIAMGLQGDAGWYNEYNYRVLLDSNYSKKLADIKSKDDIADNLKYYMTNKKDFLNFIYLKVVSQWESPDYLSLYSCGSTHSTNGIVLSIFYRSLKDKLFKFSDCWQSIMYSMVLLNIVIMIENIKKIKLDSNFILMISFVFGFMFTLVWEASARYTLPYLIYLVIISCGTFDIKNLD